MLITSRRIGESIHIDGNIEIFILDITPNRVKLGIEAPSQVKVVTRSEMLLQVQAENSAASRPPVNVEAALKSSVGRKPGTLKQNVDQQLFCPSAKIFPYIEPNSPI